MKKTHKSIQVLPDVPGVYFFIGAHNKVLYVGKATSLRDRVKSYFSPHLTRTRGAHIAHMVDRAIRVDYRKTDSVLEALLLEARLIKELAPPYNTKEKDDKSFLYVVVARAELYPRVLSVRGKDLAHTLARLRAAHTRGRYKTPKVYGPFPHAGQLKAALKIIRNIFPHYDTKKPVNVLREKGERTLIFNESIGTYPVQGTPPDVYARTIEHIILFFEGKKGSLLRALERDMLMYARREEFERAAVRKRQLFALQHIEDISLLKHEGRYNEAGYRAVRIEGYDVAHLAGSDMVGVMTVVRKGVPQKAEYRAFTIRTVRDHADDVRALKEVLVRRFTHPEWEYPALIVVDGGKAQANVARAVLRTYGLRIPVVSVVKDERHRPKRIEGATRWCDTYEKEILLANSEAHRFSLTLHKTKRAKRMRG